ncbi:MAG: hypothetical protein HXX81_04540 [Campylobacterales bacterium]|nr:hypothetical protein [Campylobacterales bacterium]
MSKKLSIIVFSFLFCLSIVSMFVVYNYIHEDVETVENIASIKKENKKEEIVSETNWLDKIAKKEIKDYSFAVNDISIKIALNEEIKFEEFFEIVVENIDEYKFFCLNQILKSKEIKFYLYKKLNFVKLIVTTNDKNYLDTVLAELKRYDIEYKVEKVIKKLN